jgi:hypothetical protein
MALRYFPQGLLSQATSRFYSLISKEEFCVAVAVVQEGAGAALAGIHTVFVLEECRM